MAVNLSRETAPAPQLNPADLGSRFTLANFPPGAPRAACVPVQLRDTAL